MRSHELLIDVAYDGARAAAAGRTETGAPMSVSLNETFVRCDLSVGAPV